LNDVMEITSDEFYLFVMTLKFMYS
jgi:hypothetical protein